MPSLDDCSPRGHAYWRSLDEFADTPQFRELVQREFSPGAADMLDLGQRRQFLKFMGASLALAGLGLSGCRRWPREQIAPYAHRPAGQTPGVPEYFATSMELGGVGSGLLVTSYDGRPIKIEGNPQHPINRGATDALAQASVLELYDPDRSRHVFNQGRETSWQDFQDWAQSHFRGLHNARGSGLYILSEATASPSVRDMKARLLEAFARAKWHEYEPINNDDELAGSILAFGSPHRSQYAFDQATVIVSLDSDFLLGHPAAVKHTRDFASTRRADDRPKSMSRLYVFESAYSLTGANADHRFAVRSTDVAAVAALLAARLIPEAKSSSGTTPQPAQQATPASLGFAQKTFDQIIHDLESHRGTSLVVAGPRQPAEVHWLVHLINEHLGNVGKTVRYTPLPDQPGHLASMTALVEDMSAGKVETLVILGGNPVYNAPADLDFAKHIASVKTTIHLSLNEDETSKRCTWHVPRAHYLESWGDARAYDGTLGIVQPLIEPLFGGLSAIELLAVIVGDELTKGHDIVRRTYAGITGISDFDSPTSRWRRTLHDGFLAGSAYTTLSAAVRRDEQARHLDRLWQRWSAHGRADSDGIELVFVQDSSVYDGRFANNGWLQELPDPMTKLTWDNAVLMSPAAAEQRGLRDGDLVRVTRNGRQIDAPICVMPGQHAHSVTLALGYGRDGAGRIAQGAGFDFYALRSVDAMGFAGGATIKKIEGSYELVRTQEHHAVDSMGAKGTQERLPTIFREANLDEYRRDEHFAHHRVHVMHRLSLWDESNLEGAVYKWGMSIDLTSCTGCSACVVACQAENNIPVVGKDQVKRGREMHWIRVDRYFKGSDAESPQGVAMQPVPCMHCENAPCEEVCPVAATTHDKDGLNVMVYNRCIGTRYCSNNCPYKVRRFNYYDYQKREPVRQSGLLHVKPSYYTRPQSDVHPLPRMQFNPEVTVRSRGVMEKCSFCLQRISAAKIKAKNEWVTLPADDKQRDPRVTVPDADLTTACAQACPAQAIVVGDLNDPASSVADLHTHPRRYEMLEELNTKPRTTYLAKLRNPATGLVEGAQSTPEQAEALPHG